MILVHIANTLAPMYLNEYKIFAIRKANDITLIDMDGDIPYGVSETPEEVMEKINANSKA